MKLFHIIALCFFVVISASCGKEKKRHIRFEIIKNDFIHSQDHEAINPHIGYSTIAGAVCDTIVHLENQYDRWVYEYDAYVGDPVFLSVNAGYVSASISLLVIVDGEVYKTAWFGTASSSGPYPYPDTKPTPVSISFILK